MKNKIYIGNQTAFFTADPNEPFDFAVANGFTAFEWFDDKKVNEDGTSTGWAAGDMSSGLIDKMRAISEQGLMRISVHARWQANVLRENGTEIILEAIEFAASIKAALVVIHFYAPVEEYAVKIIPALKKAQECNVKLAIENTPLNSPDDFNRLFAILKLGEYAESFGMCLDIGHANCSGATKNDYIRFIDELSDQVNIIHCHVHENWGDKDSHLTLFTGPARDNDGGIRLFIQRLEKRGFNGSLIMEQFPSPPQLLVDAKDRLVEIFEECAGQSYEYVPQDVSAIVNATVVPAVAEGDEQDLVDPASETADERGEDEAQPASASDDSDEEIDELDNPYALELVAASSQHTSWRTRLQWVLDSVLDESFEPTLENLATIAVYLRFIGTGELECHEDGGHYRPCHHAKAAQEIEERLHQLQTPENTWLLRRILPWLPSYDSEFQRKEPLTRIRDIAHRNDIPKDLKADIKHNLQNKLHRCAGPEDLATSERILKQITAHGTDYSHDFVEQFKVFHQELLAFFNAPELPARLESIGLSVQELEDPCSNFLKSYLSSDPLKKAETAANLRTVMKTYTDHSDPALVQSLRVADIELEDFAFSSLASVVSGFELCDSVLPGWFSSVLAALEHIRSSGFEEDECAALYNEIQKWRGEFELTDKFMLHRLRATLERARRLCSSYIAQVTEIFAPVVSSLGAALGIEKRACDLFIEGDIRANIVFILSRLCSAALKVIRKELQLPPWDVLVGGRACGLVQAADTIEDFIECDGEYIALVNSAQGDEEIPSCVRAVLLAHPLPHLSHMAVRARQAGVVLVASDDEQAFAKFSEYEDGSICISAGINGLDIEDSHEVESPKSAAAGEGDEIVPDVEICGRAVIAIAEAAAGSCGAKADGARELIDLALSSGGLFCAPKSMAVPFGAMEAALALDTQANERYWKLVFEINNYSGDKFDGALRELRKIINNLSFTAGDEITEYFGAEAYLAVRSSSNGEDLQNLAGAGLYDSVIGVPAAEASVAISSVWASLWTKRAALSRKQYGIDHVQLKMAVLLQEVVAPDFSFVMHTADPLTFERGRVGIEIACGLGETLVSGAIAGQPYRMSVYNSEMTLQAMANFSESLYPDFCDGVRSQLTDYSAVDLSCDYNSLNALATRIAECGIHLDKHFDAAQDIEGVVQDGKIWIVQSRPQTGLA